MDDDIGITLPIGGLGSLDIEDDDFIGITLPIGGLSSLGIEEDDDIGITLPIGGLGSLDIEDDDFIGITLPIGGLSSLNIEEDDDIGITLPIGGLGSLDIEDDDFIGITLPIGGLSSLGIEEDDDIGITLPIGGLGSLDIEDDDFIGITLPIGGLSSLNIEEDDDIGITLPIGGLGSLDIEDDDFIGITLPIGGLGSLDIEDDDFIGITLPIGGLSSLGIEDDDRSFSVTSGSAIEGESDNETESDNESESSENDLTPLNTQKRHQFNSYLRFNHIKYHKNREPPDGDLQFDLDEEDDKPDHREYYYKKTSSSRSNLFTQSPRPNNSYETLDVHRKQLINENATDKDQFAERYDDSLDFKLLSLTPHTGYPYTNPEANRLECYDRYIFCAASSKLVILKNDEFLKCEDTRPNTTTRQHMMASSQDDTLHHINFMKVIKFRGKDSLAICCDGGTSTFYDLEEFVKEEKLNILVSFQLANPVHGIDILDDYIVFSSMSYPTLFYFSEESAYFYNCTEMDGMCIGEANIVKVVNSKIYVGCVSTRGCVSFRGELMTLEFVKIRHIGPSDRPLNRNQTFIDASDSDNYVQCEYSFEQRTLNRAPLQDPAWAINPIDKQYFKNVSSLEYLGLSKNPIDITKILEKSKILNCLDDPSLTSNLGGAAKYETLHLNTRFDADEPLKTFERLNTFHDRIHRIRKDYMGTSPNVKELDDNFYIVSTSLRIGLYRLNGLLCNADTNILFPFTRYYHGEVLDYNHLRITRVIPELSVCISICPVGLVTIFRLVKYCGLYSLREEYSFPFDFDYENGIDRSFFLTIGCGVRKVYDGVYWIYLMNYEGLLTKFELREKDSDELSIGFL